MKFVISALVLLSASVSFACPNLAGIFSCVNMDSETVQLVITQRTESDTTIYNVDGKEMIADGQLRSDPKQGTTEYVSMTSCNEGVVTNEGHGNLVDQNKQKIGTIAITMSFTPNAEGFVALGNITAVINGQPRENSSTTICTRQ